MRKALRHLVAALAAIALVVPAAVGTAQVAPGGTFVDDDGSVHEGFVEALAARGITQGCAPALYCPHDAVTRGQMASFLVRALTGLDPASRDWFPDDDGDFHEGDIDVLAENGIARGFPDGSFRPDQAVTRGQMASFLVRSVTGLAPASRDWFPDDEGNVHEPDIDVLAENAISTGYADGTFRPQRVVSRAEMASLLGRALGLSPATPPPAAEVTAYFLMASLGDDPLGPGPFLAPVARRVEETATPATRAMQALLAGPTSDEAAGTPGISTAIPAGTRLNSVVVEGGVATVDLSPEFESGGGSFSMLARLAQVVHTLTRFPTVDAVAFEIDGTPVTVFGGEGIVLDGPQTRDDFLGLDLLPMIFVDHPPHGGIAGNPMRVTGRTVAFEATFSLAVVDAEGLIIAERVVTAGGPQVELPNGEMWTSFDVTVPYDVHRMQRGALIVWAHSARDGSRIAIREYPLWLTP